MTDAPETTWQLFRSQHVAIQALVWVFALPVPLWLWAIQVRSGRAAAVPFAVVTTAAAILLPFAATDGPTQLAAQDLGSAATSTTTSSTTTTTTTVPTTVPPATAPTTTAPPITAPPTIVPPTTIPPAPSGLAQVVVAPEHSDASYDRDLFDHWIDSDGDGCDTRCEVLESERVAQVPGLAGGGWLSLYDGFSTPDAPDLDIDHMVPLAEAWRSGADTWDPQRRRDFANDLQAPDSLIAVSASSNRSKGDRDPAQWQPPSRSSWCTYANDWIATKVRWGLTADPNEYSALGSMLTAC